MKMRLIPLLALLGFQIFFGQNYSFDGKCIYTETPKKNLIYYPLGEPRTVSFSYNSQDTSYVYESSMGKNEFFKLYDFRRSKLLFSNRDFTKIHNQRNYRKRNIPDNDEFVIHAIDIETIGENHYLAKILRERFKEKDTLFIELKLKKLEHPLVRFKFFDFNYNLHHRLYQKLDDHLGNSNYMITELYFADQYIEQHIKLQLCEEINLAMSL